MPGVFAPLVEGNEKGRDPWGIPAFQSRLADLNRRPTHYECVALPLSQSGLER